MAISARPWNLRRMPKLIEAEGLTVFPGFIDAGSSIFLHEAKPQPVAGRTVDISKYALAGMRPGDHNGLTPEFLAAEHLAPRHEDQERYRQAGFVAVHVVPTGRIASGRGTVINVASLPLRETILQTSGLATLQLSERGGGEYPATNMGVHAHLRQAFLDAERQTRQRQLFAAATRHRSSRFRCRSGSTGCHATGGNSGRCFQPLTTRDDHERGFELCR